MNDTDSPPFLKLNLPFPEGYVPKLSELVDLAIEDLRSCLQNPNIRVDMTEAYYAPQPDGKCFICAAGAVMVRRSAKPLSPHPSTCRINGGMRAEWCGTVYPQSFERPHRRMLDALNDLRCGALEEAWETLHPEVRDIPTAIADLAPEAFQVMQEESQAFQCRTSAVKFVNEKLTWLSAKLKEIGH